ncbi:MAG: DNA polymerase III subunit beta [Oscillospiraceae bacterium]
MKFICDKTVLNTAITKASRSAAQKSSIPALEGLLVEAGNRVTITGYDLKRGIYTTFEAEISDTGSVVLNTRLFGEIIRRFPDGEVTIETSKDFMTTISCGKSEFKIMGLDPEDYPLLPEVDCRNNLSLSQGTLRQMINETIFAVSDNESRPVYTGALFDIENDELTMVAVDGYRLALRKEQLDRCDMETGSFIVPGYALSDAEKICLDENEPVTIHVGQKHISFTAGDTVLISRRLDGEFLNYRKSIPDKFGITINVKRTELAKVVDRVGLIILDKIKSPLRFTFEYDMIKIVCSTSVGNAEDICFASGDGGSLEIGFNNRYMMDALKNAPAEELMLCMNTGSSPCVILPSDGSDKFIYMILPVRLRAES